MKILYVTTISLTMNFFIEHFKMLMSEGHEIELACNLETPFRSNVSDLQLKSHHIPFDRNPLSTNNISAYKELNKLINTNDYDIVHCHTPNASVIARLVCKKYRKKGLKVFYTSHGFHFYKGAPIKNWLLYYTAEKICSYFTDVLITINHEDYNLAKTKLNAKETHYIHGVGLNLDQFNVDDTIDRNQLRRQLHVDESDLLLISVGELNDNKNHSVIIKAISKLNNKHIKYIIAGKGDKYEEIKSLINQLELNEQVSLLGFREDVLNLYRISDVFCFPSIREGLGMAALEAMACELPLVVSDNRGTREYCTNDINGFVCEHNDINAFSNAISKLYSDKDMRLKMGLENTKLVKEFSTVNVLEELKQIYD